MLELYLVPVPSIASSDIWVGQETDIAIHLVVNYTVGWALDIVARTYDVISLRFWPCKISWLFNSIKCGELVNPGS